MRVGRYQAGLIKCHSLRIFPFVKLYQPRHIIWCFSLLCINFTIYLINSVNSRQFYDDIVHTASYEKFWNMLVYAFLLGHSMQKRIYTRVPSIFPKAKITNWLCQPLAQNYLTRGYTLILRCIFVNSLFIINFLRFIFYVSFNFVAIRPIDFIFWHLNFSYELITQFK